VPGAGGPGWRLYDGDASEPLVTVEGTGQTFDLLHRHGLFRLRLLIIHPSNSLLPLRMHRQAMCRDYVEAVQAYLAPLSSGNGPWADPERVHIAAADLALSLALVAECGPAAAATGPELHGLFAALVRLGPPVRYATGWAGLCAQVCCAPAVVCLLPWSGLALKGHTYFP